MIPADQIIVRANKQPYIVFSIILIPIIILSIYATIHSGVMSNFGSTFIMTSILGSIFYYLKSIRLILSDDRVMYREMWRSNVIQIDKIQAVERGSGPFNIGSVWLIRQKDDAPPIVVNVTNFNAGALRQFGKALIAKNANIRFSALPL